MTLRLLKHIIQVVVLEEDDDGNVIGERLSEPQVFYDEAEAVQFITTTRAQLAAQTNGGSDGEVEEGDGLRSSSVERSPKRGRVESEG